MEILKPAAAGTLESSDAMVTVEPNDEGVAVLVAETEGRKVLLPKVDLFKVELD